MPLSLNSKELKSWGQLFMVGLPGVTLDQSTAALIRDYGVNNFIYFKRNVESPEQLERLSAELRWACRKSGLQAPLIAIDQEGGTVTRLPLPFTQFPDARALAQTENPEEALRSYARTCATELLGIGINYNLAPVLDVCPAGRGYFMEKRSLGSESAEVGRLGSLVISEMQKMGVAASAKHFPGLGAAVVDPHYQLPSVAKEEAAILKEDVPPFKQAIAAGVASIMTSHTIYQHLDPDNPATLSRVILTGLLRNELGFEGVIITDDLEMGAIEKEGDLGQAALKAFIAGADLLLVCHSHEKVIDALQKTAAAAAENHDLAARRMESEARIAKMRHAFALAD